LLAALTIQWSFFTNAFWHRAFEQHLLHEGFIHLDIVTLIIGNFAAAAVLISFGGLLGKVSPVQLVVMIFFEMISYLLSEAIGVVEYKAVDMEVQYLCTLLVPTLAWWLRLSYLRKKR
jgi:ammonium transporter Rh